MKNQAFGRNKVRSPSPRRGGPADVCPTAGTAVGWRGIERLRPWAPFAACLVLICLAAFAFLPVLKTPFLCYDDPDYVTSNAHVRAGLSWSGVRWALFSTQAANWHPLTWVSHMLDCQVYGLSPQGHHLTNLVFHCANTLLVFLVLRGMTGMLGRSLVVAALFGVHPLHVESVAWVAERKDVLSTFFFLLTIWTYYCYARAATGSPGPANLLKGVHHRTIRDKTTVAAGWYGL